jgi:class 3 adenylate cyclase
MADEPDEAPRSLLERKLVTILSADVAEYSRLMAEDEEHTLRTFRQHLETVRALVDSHHGRIFNTAGDAILAEFTSPVEAVRCATDIQAALRSRNDLLPLNRQVKLRIGVNLGDVMKQDADLLGDGVNVAARLQGAAEPGGICLSGSVYDQIRNKLSLSFESLGERRFKNIPQPVRTFSIAGTDSHLPDVKVVRKKPHTLVMAGAAAAALLVLVGGYWAYTAHQASQPDHGNAGAPPAGQSAAVGGAPENTPATINAIAGTLELRSSALLADAVRFNRPQQEIKALTAANTKLAALAEQLRGLGTKPGDAAAAGALTAQMKNLAIDMSRNETTALARAGRAIGHTTGQPSADATQAKADFDEAIAAAQQAQGETASLSAARQAIAAFDAFSAAYRTAAPPAARRGESGAQPEEDADADSGVPQDIYDQIEQEKAADSACLEATPNTPASGETCGRRDKLVEALRTKGWCGKAAGDVGVKRIWSECR